MTMAGPIGTLVGGVSGLMMANYQAQVAENNKKVSQQNARMASERGGIEAQMADAEASRLMGEQVAQQAASGVSLSGESQIRTRAMSRFYAGADRARIRENANLEVHNYKVEAANYQAEANAQRFSGKAGLVGSAFAAVGQAADIMASEGKGGSSGSGASAGVKPSLVSSSAPPKPRLRPEGVGVAPIPRLRPLPTIGASANPLLRKKAY